LRDSMKTVFSPSPSPKLGTFAAQNGHRTVLQDAANPIQLSFLAI
jgi:hypothetical protein